MLLSICVVLSNSFAVIRFVLLLSKYLLRVVKICVVLSNFFAVVSICVACVTKYLLRGGKYLRRC